MRLSKLSIVVIFFSILVSCAAFSQDPPAERVEVASMIESHLDILGAIESYDLLIDGSVMSMIDGKPSHEIITRMRYIRRAEEQEQLYVSFSERHLLATNGKEGEETDGLDGFSLTVAILRGGSVSRRYFPKPIIREQLRPDAIFERLVGAPAFRLIGLNRFPGSSALVSELEFELRLHKQPRPGYAIVSSSDSRIAIKHELDMLDQGGGKFVRSWDYDPKNLVLTSVRDNVWNKVKKKLEPWYVEKFDWGSVGGVTVPIEISGEERGAIVANPSEDRDPNNVIIVIQNTMYDYSLRWNVVNGEIDESLISSKLLSDMSAAKAMVDPDSFTNKVKALK